MAIATFFSITSVFMVLIGLSFYFNKVKKNQTPKRPFGLVLTLIISITFSLASLLINFGDDSATSSLSILISILSMSMASAFLWTMSKVKTPLGNIKINVGEQLIPFKSTTEKGEYFSSEQFQGKRVLLKFYRGSWCPYCCLELKLFDSMKPLFDKHEIEVFAISNDSPDQMEKHLNRDKLGINLLSDSSLNIIKSYGVEHHKAIAGDSDKVKKIFGLPFPTSLKYRTMAIPTTIIVDEFGFVRWVDQSEDVRLRASESTLVKVLTDNFGQK